MWDMVSAATAVVALVGAVIIAAVVYYVRSSVDQQTNEQIDAHRTACHAELIELFDLRLRAALAAHENSFAVRLNGTYMRSEQQRQINDGFARELREQRKDVQRLENSVSALNATLSQRPCTAHQIGDNR